MTREKRIVSMPVSEEPLTLGSAKSGYQRLPFWLRTTAGDNFAWLHLPYVGAANSTGLIICNPLGYEYTHAHRSIRHLADQLAIHRYPTLRLDLYGMGDSPGDLFAEDLLARWIAELSAAVDTMKSLSGVSAICLLGIRMGATLAAKVAEHTPIEHLVLWNPVASGRRYVREMQALARMSVRAGQNHDDYIESAGFIMTAALAENIKRINLCEQAYKINGKVLIVHRDDLATETQLAAELRQQGISVDEIVAPGYAAMMAEPHETEVPVEAIADIINWLDQNKKPGQLEQKETFAVSQLQAVTLPHNNVELSEKICVFAGERNIFGILSQPVLPSTRGKPLVVLLNSGSVHHIGPNRLYVELSRALAAANFPSLRIDLANLGDSVVGTLTNENHPYPDHAIADVAAVLQSAATDLRFKPFILMGLCSGAHATFHAGMGNAAVCESIMINPLTFYWRDGMSLDIPHAHQTIKDAKYYERAVTDKSKWIKLLKGQVQLGYILRFVAKHLKQRVAHTVRHLRALTGLSVASKLAKDLSNYCESGKPLTFFFSNTDPGYDILMAEAPRTAAKHIKQGAIDVFFVEDADHTFSAKLKRDELIEKISVHLKSRYNESVSNIEVGAR